jgi:hypothetical protein
MHDKYIPVKYMKHCYAGMLPNRFRLSCHPYDITYRVLVRKPEGKVPLRIPRHWWEDNIKMGLKNICQEDVGWIHLAHDRDQLKFL